MLENLRKPLSERQVDEYFKRIGLPRENKAPTADFLDTVIDNVQRPVSGTFDLSFEAVPAAHDVADQRVKNTLCNVAVAFKVTGTRPDEGTVRRVRYLRRSVLEGIPLAHPILPGGVVAPQLLPVCGSGCAPARERPGNGAV